MNTKKENKTGDKDDCSDTSSKSNSDQHKSSDHKKPDYKANSTQQNPETGQPKIDKQTHFEKKSKKN